MSEAQSTKRYDLEDRTLAFAAGVRALVKRLPRSLGNVEDARQLIRASGSVGANYIEANEALGKKDFLLRLRISRKEAKECRYWLRLLDLAGSEHLERERAKFEREASELLRILSAIITKAQ
jgi:four helix bundle protein